MSIANREINCQSETKRKENKNNAPYNIQERESKFDEIVAAHEKKSTVQHSAIDQIQIIDGEVVEELNKKHAVVHTEQYYILTQKPNNLHGGTDFTLESKQSFLNMYENQIIIYPDGKTKNKAKIWLTHPNRRQYENGITFDPTTTQHVNGRFNIWTGFEVPAQKGSCELYKAHVKKVICGGNEEHFNYVWCWMARLVQKPNEIATGLVLMGKQGTGKGVFVKAMGKIFGKHFLHLDNIERLLGNFNFHMKNAVLVFGDEAIWGGNKKDVGKLKAMVTEEFAMIEPKGKDAIPVPNFRHFILSSNEDWPVHLDPDDRRFLILPVSEAHKEDIPYFKAIDVELKNGGYEALLYELLNVDISEYDPRILPMNTEAFPVKMQSASSAEQYVYHALKEGCFDIGNATPTEGWRSRMLVDSVFEDYCAWCTKQRLFHEKNTKLGKVLHKLISSIQKIRPWATGKRPEYYELPSLDRAKAEFQKAFKAGADIWEL